jgi:hydrogenase expression/formation protein HypC
MCLASPGEILTVDESCPLRQGHVLFGGIKQRVSLLLVPEAQSGDFVLVHAGLAIARVQPGSASYSPPMASGALLDDFASEASKP